MDAIPEFRRDILVSVRPIYAALGLLVSRDLVMAVWVARRVDDAGVVATVGEHERPSASVSIWILETDRHGATWSAMVLTAKSGTWISLRDTGLPSTSKRPSAKSLLRNSRRRYSECIRQGMRVASAFQAIRSIIGRRSPMR